MGDNLRLLEVVEIPSARIQDTVQARIQDLWKGGGAHA